MLSQRLLDIIRIYNNPENIELVQTFELIPQDIEFLRKNGLMVEVVDKNSLSCMCNVYRRPIDKESLTETLKK